MIYLDYAADSPVSEEALAAFYEAEKSYIANPNAAHALGLRAKGKLEAITKHISELLEVEENEIIYTSGATEANNLAIKGILGQYKRYGKHIITTELEHASVTGPFSAMAEEGFEVDYVKVNADGTVDLEHLKSLLREDTILVSTVYIDSECGIIQPIEAISHLVHQQPHCFYHVDATQAVGKIKIDLKEPDLVTMTAHKIGGVHGIGLLVKKQSVRLRPLHHGGMSTTPFRSGTPSLGLCASFEVALQEAMKRQERDYEYVKSLNERIRQAVSAYPQVKINSTVQASPFILNISVVGVKAVLFAKALEEDEIYIATKSACTSPNTPSRAVYAMTGDRKRAMSTLRISLSQENTREEIETFLKSFDKHYYELVK